MRTQPDSRPLVTVAIPFFNEQRFLAAAVDTVRAQTEHSWELLLVDDGSTDGSSDLADEVARARPEQIVVLRHQGGENHGVPASRNLAIDRAHGEFLCFLDADDLWSQQKLATELEMFRTHPEAVMVCGPSRHQQLGAVKPGPVVQVCTDAPRLLRRGEFARMRMRGKLTTPQPSAVMYRVDALRGAGGVPDRTARLGLVPRRLRRSSTAPRGVDGGEAPLDRDNLEDQRTFVAVSLLGPVFVDDRPLTTYTVRDDSMYGSTRNDGLVQVRTHREFERWVVSFCAHSGPHGLAVIACLLERRLRRGFARRLRLLAR